MISQSQQELIEQIRLSNEQATLNAHIGHKLNRIRWDEFHTVKICQYCSCSVGSIEFNPTTDRHSYGRVIMDKGERRYTGLRGVT